MQYYYAPFEFEGYYECNKCCTRDFRQFLRSGAPLCKNCPKVDEKVKMDREKSEEMLKMIQPTQDELDKMPEDLKKKVQELTTKYRFLC
jgi:hypothetical protein